MSLKKYHVMREIEVDAEDVVQAARRARELQLNDGSRSRVTASHSEVKSMIFATSAPLINDSNNTQ